LLVLLYSNANHRSTESELDDVRNVGYEKKKGTNWVADTRLITPYTSWTREGRYAVFEDCLLRGKMIRRNACTAVAYRDSWG